MSLVVPVVVVGYGEEVANSELLRPGVVVVVVDDVGY